MNIEENEEGRDKKKNKQKQRNATQSQTNGVTRNKEIKWNSKDSKHIHPYILADIKLTVAIKKKSSETEDMGENSQSDGSKYNETSEAATTLSSPTTSTMQSQPSTPNRFADYFVICGLDLDTGLEPDRFAGEY